MCTCMIDIVGSLVCSRRISLSGVSNQLIPIDCRIQNQLGGDVGGWRRHDESGHSKAMRQEGVYEVGL